MLLQQLPHLTLPRFVFIEWVRFVPNLVGIKLDVCIHINEAMKSFIRQLIYIAEFLNQRDFKTLYKICKLDETSCLFLLHVVALALNFILILIPSLGKYDSGSS